MSDMLIGALISGIAAAIISAITNIVMTTLRERKLADVSKPLAGKAAGQPAMAQVDGTEKIEVYRELLLSHIGFTTNKEEDAVAKAIKELKDEDKMESLVRIALKANSFKAFLTGVKKELGMK